MAKRKEIVFLLVIIAVAAFFRLWQLDSIPPGLYPDVAINGNEALNTLKAAPPAGGFKVFYPENNGREGLMIWLIALSFSIFGISIWSIKITAAIVGILTVFGLYLLTKELFSQIVNQSNSQFIALLASFFLAVSFWHTNFSRIGFRAILVPFILVFAFYFLFKGLHEKRTLYFIISGIFFGLGFYTYISYRFIVFLLPLVLIFEWFIYRKQNLQKQFLKFAICNLTFTILVALPIGIYFFQHPQDFIGRAVPISIFTAENPIKEFGKSLILHLGMFNFYGDGNWHHNFAGSPQLFWLIGILFLIGIFFSIKELLASIKEKNCSLFTVHCLLLSWFFIMLLPGILTYEGIPHALRTIGVIPVVYIFAGLGAFYTYKWFNQNVKSKKLLILASLIFLLMTATLQFNKYFIQWASHPEVKGAFSSDYVKMGNYLNSLSPEIQKYVIVNMPGVPVPYPSGIPMPAQTVMFIENTKFGQPQSIYLLPENLDKIKLDDKKKVIVPMKYDENLFNELAQKFPQGKITRENEILIYEIK